MTTNSKLSYTINITNNNSYLQAYKKRDRLTKDFLANSGLSWESDRKIDMLTTDKRFNSNIASRYR